MGRGIEVVVGEQYAEVVEIVCGTAIISVRILELTKVVQCSDLFQSQLERGISATYSGIVRANVHYSYL